jgi:hypothetical protein
VPFENHQRKAIKWPGKSQSARSRPSDRKGLFRCSWGDGTIAVSAEDLCLEVACLSLAAKLQAKGFVLIDDLGGDDDEPEKNDE